ncbi:hypothetical protein [Paraliomyxa miuraensis]|uniref:hypothetical protein n=1 Tax=Paraliomyxa miuraensis TaxID=376150 RepID=UPI002256075A|nr:hypothetical protein [Paraliomyxa miuraensis]MCX4244181.1 hypothetical protein [Paraliomyxa miuraensis]
MKLAEIPLVLQRLRTGPAAWDEVACAFEGEGATWRDAHARARYAVLLGLQYDRRPEDRELVVHLLDQEVRYAQQSPFQGNADSLRLAAFLAATLDDVSLSWLLLEAKRANFDTACGFDVETLFACGVARTWAMVLASDRPERDAFIELAGNGNEPRCTQDEVDAWWKRQHRDFPARWEDEPALARLGICIDLGDLEAGAEILHAWQSEELGRAEPGSATERQVLEQARYWWSELGNTEDAAKAQAKLDEQLPELVWDRASALERAVKIYAAAGWVHAGLERLTPLREALLQVEGFEQVGLGRMAVEVAVDLGLAAHADPQGAAQAFAWAEQLLSHGVGTSLVLLEKLCALATRLGHGERAGHYDALARTERERIAVLLSR